jgi:hypothetical protein
MADLSVSGQGVVGPLAGGPGNAGLVCVSSNVCRSRINPLEQLGEQIAGGLGWRASGGSIGIAGGATTGGKVAGVLAQPVRKSSSTPGISPRRSGLVVGTFDGFLQLSHPALFFPTCLVQGGKVRLGHHNPLGVPTR